MAYETYTVSMDLQYGYQAGDSNNIPKLTSEAVFNYIATTTINCCNADTYSITKNIQDDNLIIDYVQLRKTNFKYEIQAILFRCHSNGYVEVDARVTLKIDEKHQEIFEADCDKCADQNSCTDILSFMFWLHRKSIEAEYSTFQKFWGGEINRYLEADKSIDAVKLREIIKIDNLRLEADMEGTPVNESDGTAFVENILDSMEELNLRDAAFFRHSRIVIDEFDSIFLHHMFLNAINTGILDMTSFNVYMEEQVNQGLFERFALVSKDFYKSPIWYEGQYMRIRCSLIQNISRRKTLEDNEDILQKLYCHNRKTKPEEAQQIKNHKRFILKQTERLENKTYHECGLLISESYPYICAAPDGITDDHIVEIKSPKTEAEFESYLEGHETIAPKYMAQIQVQMYVANVTRALYCVLSPTFDTNGALHYVWVQADMEFVASLLSAAEDFWREFVLPKLQQIDGSVQ